MAGAGIQRSPGAADPTHYRLDRDEPKQIEQEEEDNDDVKALRFFCSRQRT